MEAEVTPITEATFKCGSCLSSFMDELPPLWSGFDMWPECCGQNALLVALEDEFAH